MMGLARSQEQGAVGGMLTWEWSWTIATSSGSPMTPIPLALLGFTVSSSRPG